MAEADMKKAMEKIRLEFNRAFIAVFILWRSLRVRYPTELLIEPLSSESPELSDYQALLA